MSYSEFSGTIFNKQIHILLNSLVASGDTDIYYIGPDKDRLFS